MRHDSKTAVGEEKTGSATYKHVRMIAPLIMVIMKDAE
jgi:hypothetical protein